MYLTKRELPNSFSGGQATGAGEVYEAAIDAAWLTERTDSNAIATSAAFDDRIKSIHRATGVKLDNPFDYWESSIDLTDEERRNGVVGDWNDIVAARFAKDLAKLAEQFPQHAGVIDAERSPLETAREQARAIKERLGATLDRYDGPWGTGTLSAFGGAMVGGFTDPANLASMFLGPYGPARAGFAGLAGMALKSGGVNAGVEIAMQPNIAAWHKEIGLEYGVSDFAMNVSTAFAFGAGADAGLRGAVRGINQARGLEQRLDDKGRIIGWTDPKAMPDALPAVETVTLYRGEPISPEEGASGTFTRSVDRARGSAGKYGEVFAIDVPVDRMGDLQTVRDPDDFTVPHDLQAARQVVRDDAAEGPPTTTEQMFDTATATAIDAPNLHPAELGAASSQVARHLVDPAEPLPAPPRELVEPSNDPRVQEIAARIDAGDGDALQVARWLRDMPELHSRALRLDVEEVRAARSLSRLSDEAFELIEGGDVSPRWGVMVGDLVPDPMDHAARLALLKDVAPATNREARLLLGFMADEQPAQPPWRGGLDDPLGVDGDRQIRELEELLKDDIEAARAGKTIGDKQLFAGELLGAVRRALDDEPGAGLTAALDEIEATKRMRELVEQCKL